MTATTTSPAPSESLLNKVRALLAKAESTTFPEEADAFRAKAYELMTKYQIEEALVAHARQEAAIISDRQVTIPAPFAREKAHLMSSVAKGLGLRPIILGGRGHGYVIHLFGTDADIERAEFLFTTLLLEVTRVISKTVPGSHGTARAWRASFVLGFAEKVRERLLEARRRSETEAQAAQAPGGTSVALVLADRTALINAAVHQVYPRLNTVRYNTRGTGYGAGQAAGARADLGGARIGKTGGRQAIGG
jgi:hypothetical protein